MKRLAAIAPLAVFAFALAACGKEQKQPTEPQHVADDHTIPVTKANCTIEPSDTGNVVNITVHDVGTGRDIFSGSGSYEFDNKEGIYKKDRINGSGQFMHEAYSATADKTAGTCVLSHSSRPETDDPKPIIYDTRYTYMLK